MAITAQHSLIEVEQLPQSLRKGIANGKLVRVAVEEVIDIPFIPEKETELLQALRDAREGKNVSRRFDSVADAVSYLDSEEAKIFAEDE